MSVHIPPDGLCDFLQRRGRTLLIKGDAGTGKTTLALELLRMYGAGGNGVYLSTRVSPKKLYSQFSWLGEIVKPQHVVATTYPRDETRFDDVRLGDARYILEKVLDAVKSLEAPVIVFDTWDGLAKEMEEKERVKTEKSLIAMLDASEAKAIFVSEEPERTTMDYLVDGIVTLSQGDVEGRRIREIALNKLRGTKVSPQKFIFTLNDGRFGCFTPYERRPVGKTAKWKTVPDSDGYSSGSEDLDKVLGGGYPKRSSITLEGDINVQLSAMWLLQSSLIRNFLSQGRGVMVFPTGGYSWRDYAEDITHYGETGKMDELMRIFETAKRWEGQSEPSMVPLGVKADIEDDYKILGETENTLREKTGQPLLKIFGLDTLEIRYSERSHLFRLLSESISSCRALGDLGLLVARPNLAITGRALTMTGVHLKIIERHGSVLLYGVRPRTALHVFERDFSRGYPVARFTPIV